jgi:D-aminopeptidase
MRARDLGIVIGLGRPGPRNAITDVAGVRVGHTTLVHGDGPLVVGQGPVRTGVTVIVPHDGDVWTEPVFAGCHRLNGNGELTGLEWIREAGQLGGPIGLTNTHSVGVVHDALIAEAVGAHRPGAPLWSLPVVGETYDGSLNDVDGFHVRPEHVRAALAAAGGGPVAEGGVGGGTGMVCHGFKGGIGTSSRVLDEAAGGWTVGVLVQANYGRRELLRVDGVPVGQAIPTSDLPSPHDQAAARAVVAAQADATGQVAAPSPARARSARPETGSIIVIVATDAPLLSHQCARLAQRPGLAIGRMGGTGGNFSGDLFLAFATGNRGLPSADAQTEPRRLVDLRMVADGAIDPLFDATIEATEEAIVNALVAAETMVGRDGITAHALPHERLVAAMTAAGRIRGVDRPS